VEPEAEELSGYKMSETKALRIMDLVAPEDRALAEEMLAKKPTGRGSAPYTTAAGFKRRQAA
jgi:hypothetical protein